MRLFVALPLPPDVASAATQLIPEQPAFRRVRPELLHVTLAFIGRVPDAQLDAVIAATREAASAHAPFPVSLTSAGRFPETGSPRIVWLGMREGEKDSTRLATSVRAALAARGIAYDDKPFRAHVTLARVREDTDRETGRAIASQVQALSFPPLRWTAREVLPVESVLSPKGPRYTPRAVVALGAGSATSGS